KGSAAELEARRRLAADLLRDGNTPAEVAQMLGVSVSSTKRWKQAFLRDGLAGLAAKPHPGPHPKLSQQTHPRLWDGLVAGGPSGRVQHRSVDRPSRGQAHRAPVWRLVPLQARGTLVARTGFQPTAAEAPCARTGRSGHRPVASRSLAADQKRGRRRQATIVFL